MSARKSVREELLFLAIYGEYACAHIREFLLCMTKYGKSDIMMTYILRSQ